MDPASLNLALYLHATGRLPDPTRSAIPSRSGTGAAASAAQPPATTRVAGGAKQADVYNAFGAES